MSFVIILDNPVTWGTLTETLCASELNVLAGEIAVVKLQTTCSSELQSD